MDRKAIFFDVDGTLVDYAGGMECILDSTKEAIEKIKRNGHLAVLATGRPKSFLSDEIINLNFDAYILSNGAYIEVNNNVLYNKLIDDVTLRDTVEFFNNEDMDFVLEGQKYSYFSNLKSDKIKYFLKKFLISEKNLTDDWRLEEVKTNKMVIFVSGDEQLSACVKKLNDKFTFMNHPGEMSYDVYFKNCTKADGIKKLIKHLNINIENTFAFGDGINDIEMFQTVKYGIAMENANERLKRVAYYVTSDVFSNGIYYGLKELKVI